MMKRILIILVGMLICFAGYSQSDVQARRLFVKDMIYYKDTVWLNDSLSMGMYRIKNLANPIDSTDAVNFRTLMNEISSGVSDSSYWSKSDGKLYPKTITDSLGIGTKSPDEKLHIVNGNLKIYEGKVDIQYGNSVFVGEKAGADDDGVNNQSVGVGFGALENNTSGINNVAIGYHSIQGAITGSSGSNNVGIGHSALGNITTGFQNVAIGTEALNVNTIGISNVAIGNYALSANISGSHNTANGYDALTNNTIGNENVANGHYTLLSNTTGNYNIANGSEALLFNTTGSSNIALGREAGKLNSIGSLNIFLGNGAGYFETGSNKLYIGSSVLGPLIYGEFDNDYIKINGYFEVTDSVFLPGISQAKKPYMIYYDDTDGQLYYDDTIAGGSSTVTGSGANQQLTYWNGSSTITGNDAMLFNGSTTTFTGPSTPYFTTPLAIRSSSPWGVSSSSLYLPFIHKNTGDNYVTWTQIQSNVTDNGSASGYAKFVFWSRDGVNLLPIGSWGQDELDVLSPLKASDNVFLPAITQAKKPHMIYYDNANGRLYFDDTIAGGSGGVGTVTSVGDGAGMDFGTFTTSGVVDLGLPDSLDVNSTNALTAASHTHALDTIGSDGLATLYALNDSAADLRASISAHYWTLTGDSISNSNAGSVEILTDIKLWDTVFVYEVPPLPVGEPLGKFLTQRKADSSLVWASVAQLVDTIFVNLTDTTGWIKDGNDVYLVTIGDSVGIGTASPAQKLDVVGSIEHSGIIYQNSERFISNIPGIVGHGDNVYIGSNTGTTTSNPTHVTAIGDNVLLNNANTSSTSAFTIAIGNDAAKNNIKTQSSIYIGYQSGMSDGVDHGNHNVANTAVGEYTLTDITTGDGNTVLGRQTGFTTTTGYHNTFIAEDAMFHNTTGFRNAVVGRTALYYNYTGNYNTVLGTRAGKGDGSTDPNNISGSIFLGYEAGYDEITSNKLYIENSNSANPLIYGDFSTDYLKINGYFEVTDSVFLPGLPQSKKDYMVYYDAVDGQLYYDDTIAGGGGGAGTVTSVSEGDGMKGNPPIVGSGTIDLGLPSTLSATTDNAFPTNSHTHKIDTTTIATLYALNDSIADAVKEIDDLTDGNTGGNSVFLGLNAGTNDDGVANYITAVGEGASHTNVGGTQNTAVGYAALYYNTASNNTAFGSNALIANTIGANNTATGYKALNANVFSVLNTANGSQALLNSTGGENTAMGASASLENTSGTKNTTLGAYANYNNQTGNYNTIVGYGAGQGSGTHSKSGNVFLGYQAGYSETSDNKLYIENSNSASPLVYGDFDSDFLSIYGDLGVGINPPVEKLHVNGRLKMEDNIMLNNNWLSNDGGNEGVYVDATGRVGIGTNTPSSLLTVNGSSSYGINLQFLGSDVGLFYPVGTGSMAIASGDLSTSFQFQNILDYIKTRGHLITDTIGTNTARNLGLLNQEWDTLYVNHIAGSSVTANAGWVKGTSKVYLYDNTDSVGIGTITPEEKLHVDGHIKVEDNIMLNGNWLSNDGDNEGIFIRDVHSHVGIGTNTPIDLLTINDAVNSQGITFQHQGTNTGNIKSQFWTMVIGSDTYNTYMIFDKLNDNINVGGGLVPNIGVNPSKNLGGFEREWDTLYSRVIVNDSSVYFDGLESSKKSHMIYYDTANGQLYIGDTIAGGGGGGASAINDLTDGKTGGGSVFLGSDAGFNDDGTNRYNTSVGKVTSYSNITGTENTAFGYSSLYYNTASNNTAFGSRAMTSNTLGVNNTAVGYKALNTNSSGVSGTAVGSNALLNATGGENTALGASASYRNSTGIKNVSLGAFANYNNQTGNYNTIIGYGAGQGSGAHNKSGNVFLGYQAGYNETSGNKLYIENSNTSDPLIYGDFSTDEIKINGDLEVTGISELRDIIYAYDVPVAPPAEPLGYFMTQRKLDSSLVRITIDQLIDTISPSISDTTGWIKNGNDVYLSTSTDSVGIGTSSPSEKLHITDNLLVEDYIYVKSDSDVKISTNGTLAVIENKVSPGDIEIRGYTISDAQPAFYFDGSSGYVGILTNSPDLNIDLASNTKVGGSLLVTGDTKQKMYTDGVANPPTKSDLTGIFGTPAAVGAGFTAWLDDSGTSTNVYRIVSDGTEWWIFAGTKAVDP